MEYKVICRSTIHFKWLLGVNHFTNYYKLNYTKSNLCEKDYVYIQWYSIYMKGNITSN